MQTELHIRLQRALEQAGIAGLSIGGDADCFARVPGVHPAVGDLVIQINDEDIVVSTMHIFCHFVDVEHDSRNTRSDVARQLTERALDHILAVLRDEMLFELIIENDRVTNARIVDLRDRAILPAINRAGRRVERFLWSGPVSGGHGLVGKER